MRFVKASITIAMMLAVVIVMTSCSSSSKISETPISPNLSGAELPTSLGTEDTSGRRILAVYDAVIDPIAKTFTVTPSERTADYHFPLTQLYPNVLKIVGYGWTPNFWADIKLTHPFPGSGIDGFDPRVIAILPARAGVSFNYPVFNCIGNNSVVLEPDGYTKLFDNLGGSIAGNTNPFKAYFKDQPYRVWSSTGVTSETQRWNLSLAGFGGPIVYKLVVDVSTNYPNPPQPVIDNAAEPVSIEAIIGEGLTIDGGDTFIEVTLLDWQDLSGLLEVEIESPALFDNPKSLFFYNINPESHEIIYRGALANEKMVLSGVYDLLVRATDIQTGVSIYDEFTAQVEGEIPDNPVDITPEWWYKFQPRDVFIEGNFLYSVTIASKDLYWGMDLLVFNISNPICPRVIKSLFIPGDRTPIRVYAKNGYAYIGDDGGTFYVVDIDPIDTAFLVTTIDMWGQIWGIDVYNGYAYIATSYGGLNIIDIEPPESAEVIKTINMNDAMDVQVAGEFAYVANGNGGLVIIDVEPPESAYVKKTVSTSDWCFNVSVSEGYAYLTLDNSGLEIIDVDPPESANIVKTLATPGGYAGDVFVLNDYVYLSDGDEGVQIINIQTPESAYIEKTVDLPYSSNYISGTDGFIFTNNMAPSSWWSIEIIDIEPIEEARHLKSIYVPYYMMSSDFRLDVSGDFAYVIDFPGDVHILNFEPPESFYFIKSIETPGTPQDIKVSNGFAYVADGTSGIQIMDVEPPESAHLVHSVATGGSYKIVLSNEYAYALGNGGLQIIDIHIPESAFMVNTVEIPGNMSDLCESEGFVYIASDMYLVIVDVRQPESAYIVNSVDTFQAYGVSISNGYAYVSTSNDINVFDINPPESAYIVSENRIDIECNDPLSIGISNGLAFISCLGNLDIIDIEPFESAYMVREIYVDDGYIYDTHIIDRYILVPVANRGLKIFQLW